MSSEWPLYPGINNEAGVLGHDEAETLANTAIAAIRMIEFSSIAGDQYSKELLSEIRDAVAPPFPEEMLNEALERYATAKRNGNLVPRDVYDITFIAAEHGNVAARTVMGIEQFEGDGK